MSQTRYVLSYGDAFVDYIARSHENKEFDLYLGGATVNVAAGASRLGLPSRFITITGDDEVSDFVRAQMDEEGVDLQHAVFAPEKRATSVYVHLTEESDRIFANYIDPTPDIQVKPEHLQEEAFEQAVTFHFCSGTMFHPIALETTRRAVELARDKGVLLSFDVNVRPLRWESEERCRETIIEFMNRSHMVKMTREEMYFLMETEDFEEGIERLQKYSIPLVFLTDGENGTICLVDGQQIHAPVTPVVPVDTTGAGDAFIAGVLYHVFHYGFPETHADVLECAMFGNKLGALCATKQGALTAMPRLEEIEDL